VDDDPTTGRSVVKYPVIFESTTTGYSAYVPDLPGCVAAGESLEETRELIAGAIRMHLDAMRRHGDAIPPPSVLEMVEVA
jgi:predicted RNase H-like HicB family nuclease